MSEDRGGSLLEAIDASDPSFRGGPEPGCEVIPLIDRVNALKVMELAVLGAVQSVHFTGWVFIPATPLQNDKVKAAVGGETWLDLFAFVASKTAKVRVILTDFDPLFEPGLHRLAWRAIEEFASARSGLSASRASSLQFFPSRHGAFVRGKTIAFFADLLSEKLKNVLADYNHAKFSAALFHYTEAPGHWSSIKPDMSRKRFVLSAHPRDVLHVASHHQKLCIVDGETAFCGGMDVTDLALNQRSHKLTRMHGRPTIPDLLWHDIHCRVRGPVVAQIERNFVERWRRESVEFATTAVPELAANIPDGASLPAFFFDPVIAQRSTKPRAAGTSIAQAQRTASINGKSSFATILNPLAGVFETVRGDILEGYERAIRNAQHYVYFENQYFRSKQIQALLLQRRKEVPKLQVIVVLPIAPEEFKQGETNPMVLQPMALQNDIIRTLTAELGADIGFFSLVARVASRKKSLSDEFGSPQIYVHSKICIVDDVFATIGSANANGRSFALDTELNVSWVDPALKVRAFRIDLWSELLGLPASEIAAWTPDLFTANWRRIARLNAAKSPARRSGFVVAHNHEKFDRIVGSFSLPEPLEAFLAIADLSKRPAPPELFSRDTAPERIEPIASEPSVS